MKFVLNIRKPDGTIIEQKDCATIQDYDVAIEELKNHRAKRDSKKYNYTQETSTNPQNNGETKTIKQTERDRLTEYTAINFLGAKRKHRTIVAS